MGFISTLITLIALVTTASLPATTVDPPSPPQPTLHGVWPMQPPQVVHEFAPPPDRYAAGHRGVDLAGILGAPVLTSVAGTVTFAGSVAGRGVIVISHGATRTTYEPVIAEVTPGTMLAAGERIGTLDVTQSHCFPDACLHWGWLRDQDYLDPLQLIARSTRVRLLPFDQLTPVDGPGDRQP